MDGMDPFGRYRDQSDEDGSDLGSFRPDNLTHALRRIEVLEERLVEARAQLSQSRSNNEKLTITIQQTRDQITALRDEVEKLTQPPGVYGTFIEANPDGSADIFASGRKMRVSVHPGLDTDSLVRGAEVTLNESFAIVSVRPGDGQGEVVTVKEVLDQRRVVVYSHADEERVVEMSDALGDVKLRSGDAVVLDPRSNLLIERLTRQGAEELILEEVPEVSYEDVGGLDAQIELITDAVELPYLHRRLFQEYELPAPKGILLYGPPGCGKTLIAKAVAHSLSQKVAELTGNRNVRSYFLNIKGPELLNKYVGETERQIRLVFQRAREKAEEGVPVIVFFDEMDSLFRTRGTGISSDMESTIVPQLLAEIDGVESLRDVIVIGATNREDLIDPAILRPGRLDVKIKIERPDEVSAAQIFERYLHRDLPLDENEISRRGGDDRDKALAHMIETTVEHMYRNDDENRFLEVTYQGGDKEILYFKDFASGAMIENIVRRAKKYAVKREIAGEGRGLRTDDLLSSIRDEYHENEDLPNTTNPDDWARISGKKGERIVFIRTLVNKETANVSGGRSIQHVGTGQYL
ncbi:MAG: proteasome ATPase [Acidimicrobiaceae bacterium]|nr:proteasome ATPase [Acidimicrobiaceae bacterium]